MADRKYDTWDIQKIEDEIHNVRLENLALQRELCFALTEKAKKENDWYALAFSYTFLSDYYLASRKNNQCIVYLARAKELSESKHYDDLLAKLYNFYGMFYNSICEEVTALDFFLKSLDIAESLKDHEQMASAYNNIATCFECKHDYEEAIYYYQKGYDILDRSDPDLAFSRAVTLTNLCSCARKLQRVKELETYLENFDEIIEMIKADSLVLLYLYCLSLYYSLQESNEKLFQTIDKLIEVQKRIENRLLVHQVLTNVCEILLDRNEQMYAKEILHILSEINYNNDSKSKKELQKLVVRYCEAFASEKEQLAALKDFYEIITLIEDMGLGVYSSGLSAKMELHKTKAKQSDLEKLMNVDDLTGTLNRRCFNHDIQPTELSGLKSLGIVMLDIDYFKEYNDMYGHQKGDMALIEVGKTLNTIVALGIQAYRYGGDEFSIIFKNHEREDIEQAIRSIQEDMKHKAIPHVGSMSGDTLTFSCGYAYTDTQLASHLDIATLLHEADQNLYEVKKKRDRIVVRH